MPGGGKPCHSGTQYSKQEKEPCETGKDLVKVVWFAEAVERLHQSSPRMVSPSVVPRGTGVAGSGVRASALCGFVDLQPAGEGVAKLIPQVGDLVGRYWIGPGMQQCLKCLLDNVEVDLAQFVLFHGGTPDKAASGRLTVSLSRRAQ